MSTGTRTQRRYDHRLKELVRSTGNIGIALESGVPRSTAYGWLKWSHAQVVSLDVYDTEVTDLQREVIQLRRRNARLIALLRLIMTVIKVAGFSLARVASGSNLIVESESQNTQQHRARCPIAVVDADPALSHRAARPQRRQHRSLSDNSDRIIQNVVTHSTAKSHACSRELIECGRADVWISRGRNVCVQVIANDEQNVGLLRVSGRWKQR